MPNAIAYQEWVSRVTASDGPDVIGSDASPPPETRRAYFARIAAECNEIRSQVAAARRENEMRRVSLRDAFSSGVYIALRTMLNQGPDAMRAGIEGSGLTPRRIADAIGLPESDVQAISRGGRAVTSEEYTRLAKVLSLGAGWLEYQQLSLNSDGQVSGFIVIAGQRWEAPTRAALAATPGDATATQEEK